MKQSKIFTFFLIIILISLFTIRTNAQTFNPPDWSYNKTIYEVNLRQYTENGTFKEFELHLPRLKEMGVGILWFMPIHPIGEKNRKGTLGSYYSVKDYKAVNPEFGNLQDFKSLVDKIHKMGMHIILDWVANHTSWDNVWVEEHPDFYTKDSSGNMIPSAPDWTDIADLNYDNKELWKAMIGALKFWVEECNIDGYRCDVAGMVPIEFWIEARKELDKIKPVFMLAEWDTPEIHNAFDMSYGWTLHGIINEVAKGIKPVKDLIVHFNQNNQKYPENAFKMQFTSNHDENSWNGTVLERLGDGAEAFAVFTCLIPDMPLIYSGQEAGMNKRLEFFNKDLIEWKEHRFESLYTKLFNLKKENEALFNGNRGGKLIFLNSNDESSIIGFTREKNEDKVLAIFNLSDDKKGFVITGSELAGGYRNLFTGKVVNFLNEERFNLSPWEYKVFVK